MDPYTEYSKDPQNHVRKSHLRWRQSPAPSTRNSIAIHEDTTRTESLGEGPISNSYDAITIPKLGQDMMRVSSDALRSRRRPTASVLADKLEADDSDSAQFTDWDNAGQRKAKHGVLRKESRRRTIFIPDDTTVATIHPGQSLGPFGRRVRSPDIGFDLVTLSEDESEESLKPSLREKNAVRKSLAVAPKRAPLGQCKRPRQGVAFAEDIMGAGGGKENVPPSESLKAKATRLKDEMARARLQLGGFETNNRRRELNSIDNLSNSQFIAPKKRTGSDSILAFSPGPTRVKLTKSKSRENVAATASVKQTLDTKPSFRKWNRDVQDSLEIPSAPITQPRIQAGVRYVRRVQELDIKYPVLGEDLVHPEPYEDHWLHHQEVGLLQLLNCILQPLQNYRHSSCHGRLRKELLVLYQSPEVPLLHKRLQASLRYGALSISKHLLTKASRLKDDVGLRKKFLALFTDSYDLDVLLAAAEIVFGRELARTGRSEIPADSVSGSQSQLATNLWKYPGAKNILSDSTLPDSRNRWTHAGRKEIEQFLYTFLVKHEDTVRPNGTIASIARGHNQGADDFGSHNWAWRRTVLRSLMLILLLDQAKSSGSIGGCLFQSTSPHKSTAAVIAALSALIFPSLGDLIRPLSRLSYHVKTIQRPLQEYVYRVQNLETDLRDGVVLTRLVALTFLNTPGEGHSHSDQTFTVSMPTGEEATSPWTEKPSDEWILSKHLRFPCIGRSVKLYNVRMALCAVAKLGGAVAKAAQGITAEDIVDGHREKTLYLLWAIVGNCRLESLLDWEDIKKEIQYFNNLSTSSNIATGVNIDSYRERHNRNYDDGDDETRMKSLKNCSDLLLVWAQSIASLQNIHVTNLTTSFADHTVFEAIVDAYLVYLPNLTTTSTTISNPATSSSTKHLNPSPDHLTSQLTGKLKTIGSSPSFTSLFSQTTTNTNDTNNHKTTTILSKSFTLTTLTFLASRLIPLARTHRAATKIQHNYRARLARLALTRRITCMRLAHHCANLVRSRDRVCRAVVVLQRAWRGVLRCRRAR